MKQANLMEYQTRVCGLALFHAAKIEGLSRDMSISRMKIALAPDRAAEETELNIQQGLATAPLEDIYFGTKFRQFTPEAYQEIHTVLAQVGFGDQKSYIQALSDLAEKKFEMAKSIAKEADLNDMLGEFSSPNIEEHPTQCDPPWIELGADFPAGESFDDRYVGVAYASSAFYFFEKTSDESLWSVSLSSPASCSPAFSRDGEYLAVGSGDHALHLFVNPTKKLNGLSLPKFWLRTDTGFRVSYLTFSRDSSQLLAANRTGDLTHFHLREYWLSRLDGRQSGLWQKQLRFNNYGFPSFSSDGTQASITSELGDAYILDALDGDELWHTKEGGIPALINKKFDIGWE